MPRYFCTKQAVDGIAPDGVEVAQMIRPMSQGEMPAFLSASSPARTARVIVRSVRNGASCPEPDCVSEIAGLSAQRIDSSGCRQKYRVLIPVRGLIQASDVSSQSEKSSLEKRIPGTAIPVPINLNPLICLPPVSAQMYQKIPPV